MVTPAPLVITANNQGKAYGTTLTLGSGQTTFTSSGLVNSETVGSVTLASAGAVNTAPAGTYALVPSLAVGGTFNVTNYSISYSNGVLTVNKVLPVTTWAPPTNIVYGTVLGTNQNDAVSTVGGSYVYNPTNGVILPVGTNALNVVFTPTDTNYLGTNLTVQLVVTPAPLVVKADDQIRGYDQPNPVFTYTVTGFVNGENSSVLTGTPALSTSATLLSAPGAYAITVSKGTLAAANYSFSFTNGTLTVTPATDLAVIQSGPTNAVAGSNLVYTVSVTNRGPVTATSLIISNQLAAGFTFVSASASGSNLNNVVTWNFASLPVNGVTNLTVTVFAVEGGTFTNIASGANAAFDFNPTNNDGSLSSARTRTVISALADVAVFKVGGTNVFAGQSVAYTITATNAGPSTATNVVVQDNLPSGATLQNASGTYTLSNGVVRWAGLTMAPGTATTFTLSLIAPASATSFLNVALATSPTADPNPTNNNGSYTNSRVTTTVTPSADVVVLLVGPPTAIQGSNFVYNLTVTNAGPSTCSNLVVSDVLPPGLVFVAASSGGLLTNGVVVPHIPSTNNVVYWPQIKSFAFGAVTNYTITVYSLSPGTFTNVASALAITYDPNPTNNSGVLPIARVQTVVQVSQFSILAGTPVLNPQTGLYEETATVTNTGNTTILGFRLFVAGLRSGVTLWNANGTNSGVPFINYNFPVDPSNSVQVILEFYNPSRLAFSNTLSAQAILPGNITSTSTNGSVPVSRVFTDNRIEGDPRFVIEFASVPGATYAVIYSSSLTATNWNVATPSLKASANVTQWYDDGPPKTESKPASVNARYYRVLKF